MADLGTAPTLDAGAQPLRINRRVASDAVHWARVLEVLVSRFRLPFEQADRELRDFLRRLRPPLDLSWFLARRMSAADNRIALAMAEVHSADTLELTLERTLEAGPARCDYHHSVLVAPRFKQSGESQQGGTILPRVTVGLFGRTISIESLAAALALQLSLLVAGAFTYVLFVGLILYGASVFLVWLFDPVGTTIAATRDATLGMALICFLAGAAGIFGRAVANVGKLVLGALRRRAAARRALEAQGSI